MVLMKKFSFFPVLLFFSLAASSQDFIPPTPEVASLLKVGNNQIDESKGRPHVEIPLYTINTAGIQIPLKMIYSSSGVKVEDEASWVGNSWNLSHTGVVNRNQRGLPDEMKRSVYYVPSTFAEDEMFSCQAGRILENVGWFYRSEEIQDHLTYLKSYDGNIDNLNTGPATTAYYDSEPDLFEYILPTGGKGSFIFENKNKILNSNNHKIEVEFDFQGNIDRFLVIDEFGNKFYFSVTERRAFRSDPRFFGSIPSIPEKAYYGPSGYGHSPICPETDTEQSKNGYSDLGTHDAEFWQYNVSWYLSKVVTSQGGVINYGYNEINHTTLSNTNSKVDDHWDMKSYSSNQQQVFKAQVLEFIDWEGGKIEFIKQIGVREDVRSHSPSGASSSELKALKEIKVSNSDLEVIKDIIFELDYVLSNDISEVPNNDYIYLYKRLWLNSLKINDEVYRFEYSDEENLPYKFSFAQDYWGYYRGSTSGNFIPILYFYPDDASSLSAPTDFSFFKRLSFLGQESTSNTINELSYRSSFSNRNPDFDFSDNGLLSVVTFPTGGKLKIEYEPNSFIVGDTEILGNGSRVSKLEWLDFNGETKEIKNYFYNTVGTGLTSGRVSQIPIYGYHDERGSITLAVGSHPLTPFSDVTYTNVTIRSEGNGRVEKEFYYPFDINKIYSLFDEEKSNYLINRNYENVNFSGNYQTSSNFPQIINGESLNGKLINEKYYNEDNNIVLEKKFEYRVARDSKIFETYYDYLWCGECSNPDYYFHFNQYLFSDLKLSKTLETNYLSGNTLTKEVNIIYNNLNLPQTVEEKIGGDVFRTKINYPNDLSAERISFEQDLMGVWNETVEYNVYGRMFHEKNMVHYPIETIKMKNLEVIAGEFNAYKGYNTFNSDIGMAFALGSKWELRKSNDEYLFASTPNPEFNLELILDEDLDEKILFEKYDRKGNLLQFRNKNGIPFSFIWGYNAEFPIAKIENVTYSEIEALPYFGSSFSLGNGGLNTNQENSLRTGLPDAMITTYTYKPLVGVTSITDERGYTINYYYDEFNRLQFVKNEDGNILSENKYNYKGFSN